MISTIRARNEFIVKRKKGVPSILCGVEYIAQNTRLAHLYYEKKDERERVSLFAWETPSVFLFLVIIPLAVQIQQKLV